MTAPVLPDAGTDPAGYVLAVADLREQRATAVPHGPWSWAAMRGYPQRITNPQAVLIAETYENPDFPTSILDHIVAEANPAHALAEVALWRRLARRHLPYPPGGHDDDQPYCSVCGEWGDVMWPCPDLLTVVTACQAYAGGQS